MREPVIPGWTEEQTPTPFLYHKLNLKYFLLLILGCLLAQNLFAMRKLTLALLLSMLWAGMALAETIDGFTYTLDASTSTATVTDTPSGNVVIPATIKYNNRTYNVTAITGVNSGITSCEIPEGVTSIGTAFYVKSYLTSVSIPSTVQRIEKNAFSSCSSLTSVVIPEGVTFIGKNAFSSCIMLSSVTIPTTLTSMAGDAFHFCDKLKTIIWNAKHCVDFETSPFSSCYYYVNGYNGDYMGNNCTTSIIFGDEVEYIPAYLCSGFYALSTIIIPNSVKEIGDYAFDAVRFYTTYGRYKYDTTLSSISLGMGLEKIGAYAFYGRTVLASVTIPDKCTTIDPFAFANCSNLSTVTFGKGMTTIGTSAFGGNNKINTINIYATAPPVISGKYVFDMISIGDHNYYGISDFMSVTLNVRSKAVDAYKAADVWKDMYVQAMENDLRTFTLNVSSADESMGTTSPGGMFDENSEVLIFAAAKNGYKFKKWNDGNTDNPRTVTMIGDLSFVAYFETVIPDNPNPGDDNPDDPEPVNNPDTDISSMNNVIYLNKVEASADSQINLSIRMKNSAAIRGFQFDLYLPEGVTVVKSAKGKIIGSLSEGRLGEDDEHSLTLSEQGDGAIRFLCGSLYDETFTGNDGEIATLTVKIAEDMSDGDYPIILRNMKLTETDINNYYQTDYVKSTLTITSYTLGDINRDQKIDVSDYIGIANHILGNTPDGFVVKAADVNLDGNIDVSDYIGVANIILTGSIYGGTSNAPVVYFLDEKNQEVDPD